MKLSIVVPVYNEERFLAIVLERIQSVPLAGIEREIIVVDDGSNDGTRPFLVRLIEAQSASNTPEWPFPVSNIKIVLQRRNAGKGAALRTGFQRCEGEIILIQDADLEYNPADYPKLLAPLLDGRADVVFGSRILTDQGTKSFRLVQCWGNRLLTWFSNMLSGQKLTDMETCYKVFRRDVLQRIELFENRFGIEPEMVAKISRLGCRICEVPISYVGRSFAEGKKIRFKDGLRALWCILKYNLRARTRPRRVSLGEG